MVLTHQNVTVDAAKQSLNVFLIVTFPTFQQHFARFIIIGTAAAVADDQPNEWIDWKAWQRSVLLLIVELCLRVANPTFEPLIALFSNQVIHTFAVDGMQTFKQVEVRTAQRFNAHKTLFHFLPSAVLPEC